MNQQQKGPYEALNAEQLRSRLGHQCSPDPRRQGYVIGPDITGRICHMASCIFMSDAINLARDLNEKHAKKQAEEAH